MRMGVRFMRKPTLRSVFYSSRVSSQACTSSAVTREEKRIPSSHSPLPASSANSSPLSPRSELEEVQKGITVLPVKSLASTNVSTGQAAMPHHIACPN